MLVDVLVLEVDTLVLDVERLVDVDWDVLVLEDVDEVEVDNEVDVVVGKVYSTSRIGSWVVPAACTELKRMIVPAADAHVPPKEPLTSQLYLMPSWVVPDRLICASPSALKAMSLYPLVLKAA